MRPEPYPDIDAVGDDRLQSFGAALGVKDFQQEPVLLEEPVVLADLGDALLPAAALADRNLESLLCASRGGGQRRDEQRQERSL